MHQAQSSFSRNIRWIAPILTSFSIAALSHSAHAAIFTTPQFIEPGHAELGLAPELVLSDGAGLGLEFRFKYGLTELNNVNAFIGTGSGPREFRVGGNFTFDFFPDIGSQPGIGIALQAQYTALEGDHSQFEAQALPYIHKAFQSSGGTIDPYFTLPFGMAFQDGEYRAIATAVIGAIYMPEGKFRYVTELGIAINNTETYLSGGVAYLF